MTLYWIFFAVAAIQWEYPLKFFSSLFLQRRKVAPVRSELQGVSVIICARNEAENLRKNLPAVLAQQYGGRYEVIVVNDASSDDTAGVLKELEQRYDHLCYVTISTGEERVLKGKKFALSRGVAAAKYDWLLLTDADCMPASNQWLAQMVAPLANGKEIVAGYGGYYRRPGLLNAFIRWETLHTFLQYSTYALAGKPYMATGRNMACTKQAMERAQQSEVWNKIPSGDDDLLVRVCGTENNTAIVSEETSFTWSPAKATWKEWIRQKQRHLSAGKYYKTGIKVRLGIYGAAHAVTWLLFFTSLYYGKNNIVEVMAIRCVLLWLFWAAAAVKLKARDVIIFFPLFDIGWMLYNFAFLPYITWKNKQQWT